VADVGASLGASGPRRCRLSSRAASEIEIEGDSLAGGLTPLSAGVADGAGVDAGVPVLSDISHQPRHRGPPGCRENK
jgi:hypothetical protein